MGRFWFRAVTLEPPGVREQAFVGTFLSGRCPGMRSLGQLLSAGDLDPQGTFTDARAALVATPGVGGECC